jgi:thymidylate synthase (FAD)
MNTQNLTVNESLVEYIDHMGDDLTVVNSAKVSFDKESIWETIPSESGETFDELALSQKDTKLINYLAKHDHWSPFAHNAIQLRFTTPVFMARQLVKHQVGGVWNEVSRRYVDTPPAFYCPLQWRKRPEGSVKQGSGTDLHPMLNKTATDLYMAFLEHADSLYKQFLGMGIAPEQARIMLPISHMTSWYWTGSLAFFHRVYSQRIDDHAQKEAQDIAKKIGSICTELFPVSWKALCNQNS